jgi:hypothetical protein
MKALIQKEIRLLAPAYGLALLLAIVPVWLLPEQTNWNNTAGLSVFLFWFGAMMLALSAFGREFGLATFPLVLVQPLERNRIWRTKIGVLAGAMASAFAAWFLSCAACVRPGVGKTALLQVLPICGTMAIVTFAGGLWTTLVLRQVSAAFWFTILIPGAILIAIQTLGGSDAMVFAALGLYSILGFLWARRLFFRFQEAGWTGGVISFSGWRKEDAALRPALRAQRPLAALFWKELRLQQVSLAGMGLLFLMHLGVVAVRRFGHDSLGDTLLSGLEVFGGLWLLVPLLVGSSSVAEERKFGAAPEHLCLPVSSRLQYVLKLLVVLVLGGVLSGLLLRTAEGIGKALGGRSNLEAFKMPLEGWLQGGTFEVSTLICIGLSLVGFYASTLTRSIVQALGAAAATAAGVWVVWLLAAAVAAGNPIFGVHPWLGYLVFYIGWPALAATFVALGFRNFRCGSQDWRLWRGNLLSLAGALLLIATLTTATYHRAWELVTPLEPRHGPNRLLEPAGARPLQLYDYGGWTLAALLPDGRLWVDRIGYEPGRLVLAYGEQTGFRVGGKWGSVSGNQIEPGSNWVAVAANFIQTVAIRADGTLWVSEKPRPVDPNLGYRGEQARLNSEPAAPLVRFGQETNWQSVVRQWYEDFSVILQKRDGTLWLWRHDHPLPKNAERLGLRSFEPHRLGTESDWARILSPYYSVYAWKNDGRAWVIHRPSRKPRKEEVSLAPGVVIERSASLDNFRWLSLARCWPWYAAVREDGTLWAWTDLPPADPQDGQSFLAQPPVQIGHDRDWRAVGGGMRTLTALKADGSLWQWQWQPTPNPQGFDLTTSAPARLGTHRDWIGVGWIAVGDAMDGTVSLAADGSLWYWWTRGQPYYDANSDQPMLAPSRRPSKIENILDGKEPGPASP